MFNVVLGCTSIFYGDINHVTKKWRNNRFMIASWNNIVIHLKNATWVPSDLKNTHLLGIFFIHVEHGYNNFSGCPLYLGAKTRESKALTLGQSYTSNCLRIMQISWHITECNIKETITYTWSYKVLRNIFTDFNETDY